MKRLIFRLAVCAFLIAMLFAEYFVRPASAGPITLDQNFSPGLTTFQNGFVPLGASESFSGGGADFAQTFTVGINGTLSSVAVLIQSDANLVLDIRLLTPAGLPESQSSALASVTLLPPIVPENRFSATPFFWVSADLSSFNIPVVQGEQLAIVLNSGAVNFRWGISDNPIYPLGASYYDQLGPWTSIIPSIPIDFDFQTYIDTSGTLATTPEPSSLALLAIGSASMAGYGWRRRKKVAPI
jgi:PEP-CTERM motif